MELVEGDTLAERVKTGPIPITEVLAIARQISEQAFFQARAQGTPSRINANRSPPPKAPPATPKIVIRRLKVYEPDENLASPSGYPSLMWKRR